MAMQRAAAPANPIRLVTRVAALEDEIERLQTKLELVKRLPQDEYLSGAVVIFEKQFVKGAKAPTYTYAAVKGGAYWYLSGNGFQFTWEQLLDKLYGDLGSGGQVSCWYVSEMAPVL